MPFEIKAIKAKDDGFELEFTKPVNRTIAEDPETYEMISFNYKYHFNYGSPIVDQSKGSIENVVVAADGMSCSLDHKWYAIGVHTSSKSGESSVNYRR